MRSFVLSVVLLPVIAAAFELRRDSEGDVVRWPREVVFCLDPSLASVLDEPNARAAIEAAIAEVNDATPELKVSLAVKEARGAGYELGAGAANQNDIFALTDWPYTDGALASTVVTVNARTNEILDTDIVFNAEQHTFRVLKGPSPAQADVDDVQNTVTHELGHALGLMHNAADESVVMYPRALAGEVRKRALHEDDRLGLMTLYAEAAVEPSSPPMAQGCSSSGGSLAGVVGVMAFAMLVLCMGRPRRVARAAVVVRGHSWRRGLGLLVWLCAGVLGARVSAQPAADLRVGVVKAQRASWDAAARGVIVTTLEVEIEQCASSACEAKVQVVVPGGRVGDLEQVVEHHPVPAVGERLGLARKNGRWSVYRLADPGEAARFAARWPSSSTPSASGPPRASPAPLVPVK